jgi:hypothetical protein
MTPIAWPTDHHETSSSATQAVAPREIGSMVGTEMLRMAWMAHHMGVEFDVLADWDDEICPPWPTPPQVPSHVWPYELGDIDDSWVREYHHGLAATLERARGHVRTAPIVTEALGKARLALELAAG